MRMESRKRMDYGFQGYQAPPLPRAMRSARGRGGGLKKKNWEENGMAVFEMLATVAEDVLEAEKCEPGIEVFKSSDHCMEVGNNLSEQESSAEQALLELDKSRSLAHGDGAQWPQGFPCKVSKIEPDDQGSSDEKAVVSGAPIRKLLSEEVPLQGDYPDNTIQTASRSISSKSELDCHGQSHLENEKDPDTCLNALAANEKPMQGSSPGEGEDKHGCWTDKERYSTNACKGNFLTEQSLLSSEQNLPLSVVELTKEAIGFVENGEGKGENEIEESNLGHWKRSPHGNENMVDELMHDSHSLPASSAVSEEAPMFADTKPPPLISSGSSEDLPLCGGSKPCDSFFNSPNKRVNVCRDDDDNSSGCTTPSRIIKKSRKISYLRAARRSITSKLWKAASASSRKRKHSDIVTHTERIVKTESPDCGEGYTRRRTGRCSPVKRKRLAKETFFPASDFHTSTTSATCLDNNCVGGEPPVSTAKIRRAKSSSVASSPTSAAGFSKHSSNKSGEPHVKLSIKSFTIPELFIDMPESATVASLKRAVMEAAMNLLGDELRVCVLLQGKKLCDEGDTLYQLGISHGGKLDSVGFMLEPNPMPTSQACAEDPLFVLSRAAAQPSARYQTVSASVQASASEGNKGPTKVRSNKLNGTTTEVGVTAAGKVQTDTTQWAKSEYETTDSAIQNGSNPGALIVHPSVGAENVQGLALVPLNHKSQDVGKRRIRRPFTVAEVEALVQAVETLGTGRWRDVKLRAFEHAKHRTYVDLKDKWKTLVHTAKIAPHQRRGEPVPQELLDRVIQAHNYWTDQQAKQQAELCL